MYIMIYVCVYLLIFHIYNISSCIRYIYVTNISKIKKSLNVRVMLNLYLITVKILHSHIYLFN